VRWNDAGGCIWAYWCVVGCIWARWNHATLGLELQQKLQESNAATIRQRNLGYAADRNDAHYCDQKFDVK
jgi:hypothetical protein